MSECVWSVVICGEEQTFKAQWISLRRNKRVLNMTDRRESETDRRWNWHVHQQTGDILKQIKTHNHDETTETKDDEMNKVKHEISTLDYPDQWGFSLHFNASKN